MIPFKDRPQEKPGVQAVLNLASTFPCKLYMVGGYLRDSLLKRDCSPGSHKDFDFMVMNAKAIDFARHVSDRTGAHFVLLDESNDTARVVSENGDCFDFAGCVGGSLETDLRRRDFTMNALAWDPEQAGELIDIVGARADIENRLVRAISRQSFIDDPLRLLRTHRFAALLDFDIEDTTSAYIKEHAGFIKMVAAERISSELFLMLDTPRAGVQVKKMADNGLLEAIFPELLETRRVTPNAYHHLALFDHSVESLVQAEKAIDSIPEWACDYVGHPISGGVSRFAVTKLAALVHDIGKPDTWVITPEGKHTFIGHDKLGAEMVEPLAKRMKWSKPVERLVEKLVRWHLRPGHLFQQGPPTDKAKYRFYKTIGEELPELIVLALADFRSTCGPGLQDDRKQAEENLLELLRNFSVYQVGQIKESRFLDGNELMKLLGIKPGPIIGEILDELLEAQVLGEVQNYDQAADLARKLYQEKYCR